MIAIRTVLVRYIKNLHAIPVIAYSQVNIYLAVSVSGYIEFARKPYLKIRNQILFNNV